MLKKIMLIFTLFVVIIQPSYADLITGDPILTVSSSILFLISLAVFFVSGISLIILFVVRYFKNRSKGSMIEEVDKQGESQ